MTQSELHRALSRTTGESVSRLRRMGFSLASPRVASEDDPHEAAPQIVDWDDLQAKRALAKARS